MAHNQDGNWLASARRDNTVRVWLMDNDALIKIACDNAGRNLFIGA